MSTKYDVTLTYLDGTEEVFFSLDSYPQADGDFLSLKKQRKDVLVRMENIFKICVEEYHD